MKRQLLKNDIFIAELFNQLIAMLFLCTLSISKETFFDTKTHIVLLLNVLLPVRYLIFCCNDYCYTKVLFFFYDLQSYIKILQPSRTLIPFRYWWNVIISSVNPKPTIYSLTFFFAESRPRYSRLNQHSSHAILY